MYNGRMKKLHAVVCGVALSMTSFSDVMTDCYWHWMNGNISKDGIAADLEYMKAGGIQAAMIFDVGIGAKRFVFHSIVHQPSNDSALTMGPFGTRFNRAHCTVGELKALTTYIMAKARSDKVVQRASCALPLP